MDIHSFSKIRNIGSISLGHSFGLGGPGGDCRGPGVLWDRLGWSLDAAEGSSRQSTTCHSFYLHVNFSGSCDFRRHPTRRMQQWLRWQKSALESRMPTLVTAGTRWLQQWLRSHPSALESRQLW